jgi:hypothetical protein
MYIRFFFVMDPRSLLQLVINQDTRATQEIEIARSYFLIAIVGYDSDLNYAENRSMYSRIGFSGA